MERNEMSYSANENKIKALSHDRRFSFYFGGKNICLEANITP